MHEISFNLSGLLLVFNHFNFILIILFVSLFFTYFYVFFMLLPLTAAMLLFYVKHFELFCT